MKLKEFLDVFETIAPKGLAMEWDNVGLLVGPDHEEVNRVLVALDCTPVTAKEAADTGADLLLTHHPVFFNGIKRFLPDDPDTAGPYILARHGIGHVAAHTNLDAVSGGVNDALAQQLGLIDPSPMEKTGLGRVGMLETPMTLRSFSRMVEKQLDTVVRVNGESERVISRAAVMSGAGGDDIADAFASGADVYVTGECRHHQALRAGVMGICVVEAGHYETERVVLPPLIKRLQELAPGVQYNLTRREQACLRRL